MLLWCGKLSRLVWSKISLIGQAMGGREQLCPSRTQLCPSESRLLRPPDNVSSHIIMACPWEVGWRRRGEGPGMSGTSCELHALSCAFPECKFTCTSGKCLYLGSLVCNQQNDCGDNSDEENCLLVTEHPPPGIFNCKSLWLTLVALCLKVFWSRQEVDVSRILVKGRDMHLHQDFILGWRIAGVKMENSVWPCRWAPEPWFVSGLCCCFEKPQLIPRGRTSVFFT